MKRAFRSLVAATCLIMVGGLATEAEAQKQRVVVEQFTGSHDARDKFRQRVIDALEKAGVDVVSDKKVAATEAELGLLSVADNYAAASKELKATAFVTGSVGGTKKVTGRVKVKDASGTLAGEEKWTGASAAKMMASASNLQSRVKQLLGSVRAAEKAAPAAAPPPPAPVAEAPAEEPKSKPKKKEAAPKEEKRAALAATSDTPPNDADATVSADADEEDEEDDESGAGILPGLDLQLGMRFYSRHLTYNQSLKGGQQEYKLPKEAMPYAPSLALAADYFFSDYAGLGAVADYSFAVFSRDTDGNVYRTSSYGFGVDAKGKYDLGSTEITAAVGYRKHVFLVDLESDEEAPIHDVPAVDYGQVRAGLGARLGLGKSVALMAGAAYLHLLSMGELKDDYFPNATGRGGEGFAGIAVALPWVRGMDARATVDVRRYAFAFNPTDQTDERVAGGAIDQYIGLTVAVGYRNR